MVSGNDSVNIALKKLQIDMGVTGKDLARLTGIHHSTISRITNGWLRPSERQAEAICSILGVSRDEIFPIT